MATRKPCSLEPIKSRISGNLTPLEIADVISNKCVAPLDVPIKKNDHYVFFTPHGRDTFISSVNYGKWVAENELESHYFLEGYFFVDKRNISTTVVTNVITPYSASQGKSSAQLYSETNNAYKLVEQKELELTKFASKGKKNSSGGEINPFYEKFGPPIRVGFGHTHPNLSVFFSSVDKTSVFAAQGEPWVTMVADPRREELLAAVGPRLETAHIVMFKERSIAPSAKPEEKNEDTDTKLEKSEWLEFIRFVEKGIENGATLKITLKGALPGKLNFKGEYFQPNKRPPKGKRR